MSRTLGISLPSRKSKRLYENGYYQIEQREGGETSGCIGCRFNHKTPSPKHGRTYRHSPEDCDSVSKSSESPVLNYTPNSRKTRYAKQRRQTPTSTTTLPPISSNPLRHNALVDKTSAPVMMQRHFQQNGETAPSYSFESLAAGEHIRSSKKSKDVISKEVKHSSVVAETEQATSGAEVNHLPNLIIRQNYIESDDHTLSFSDDQSREEEFSDASIEAASFYQEKDEKNSLMLLFHVLQVIASYFTNIIVDMIKACTRLVWFDTVLVLRDAKVFFGFRMILKIFAAVIFLALFSIFVLGGLPDILSIAAAAVRSWVYPRNLPATKTSPTPKFGSGVLEKGLQKLELSFEEMQLHIADRHATMTRSIEMIQKKFDDNNEKITENQKSIMSAVEATVSRAITVSLLKNNEVFQNKIEDIQAEMSFLQANHSNMVSYLQKEIYGKVGMAQSIHDSLLDKLGEFEKQMIGIENKIAGLAKDQSDFKTSIAQRSGNVTFLREVSNEQFIENFIVLLQKGANLNLDQEKISDRHHHKYLAYLLLEWFARKGFVEEKTLKKAQDQTARNFTKLQNHFKETLDKNLMLMKRTPYKPGLTLDSISSQGPSRLTEGSIKHWIKEALDRYSSDRIGIPDFALESAGASIVTSRCSASFQHKTALFSLFGMPIYYNTNSPRFIIQPGVMPGECWAFKGPKGYVVIGLSATIRPDSVTIDHIPKSLAFYDSISSAPKDFAVYGLKNAYDVSGKLLGMFRYEESDEPIQQFVLDPVSDSFNHIELKIDSNWGQPDFTCLYRFRVHDKVGSGLERRDHGSTHPSYVVTFLDKMLHDDYLYLVDSDKQQIKETENLEKPPTPKRVWIRPMHSASVAFS